MVQVDISDNKIQLSGHAQGEYGSNIYCAAVSMLTYNLQLSLNALCPMDDVNIVDDGNVFSFSWEKLSREATTIVSSFLVGISALAEEYPDRVTINRDTKKTTKR